MRRTEFARAAASRGRGGIGSISANPYMRSRCANIHSVIGVRIRERNRSGKVQVDVIGQCSSRPTGGFKRDRDPSGTET
jgi:hypothetical protein